MSYADAEKRELARTKRRAKKLTPRMRVSGRGMKRFAAPRTKT